MATSFGSDFRRSFSRGLAAILPTVLTVAIIGWLIQAIHSYIGQYISAGTRWLIGRFWKVDATTLQEAWRHYQLDILGFVLAIILVYILGRMVASLLGRSVWRSLEGFLIRLPLIKQIYPTIKQVTDFLILSDPKVEFSRVVAVEYPRKGLWSMGLVTNPGMRSIQKQSNVGLLTVFIPSSPTPVTGYTITVRRDEVIDLPIDIDEALRFVISGGVILPSTEAMEGQVTDRLTEDIQRLPTRSAP
ncbi:MAG: DUF502 domain-containing protein [Planctomycetes bacterium]|nr:DUF502 domain-containing protein [Planctomycetota bacterium]